MVRPRIDLKDFRLQIQYRLLIGKQIHAQIAEWLKEEGITITARFFKHRCKEWAYSRRGITSDQATIAHITNEVHTTNHTDERIAGHLTARGLHIS
jgi:hypothetical protein